MTKSTEQVLRQVFAAQAAQVSSTTDFYAGIGARNRRRRRRQVIGAAIAVAVVATGVPLTLAAVRGAGGPSAPTAAGPTAAKQPIRGSLAGDRALIDEAVRLLLRDSAIDRSSVQVSYAEQSGGYRIVVLAGIRPSSGEVASMVAGGAPGAPLETVGGGSGTPQAADARLGQQYLAPQHVLTRFTIGDRSFGLALFPAGYRATIRRGPSIAADCRLDAGQATALPLPAFFPVDGTDAPNVAVYAPQGTKPALSQPLEPSGNGSALPELPPAGEIAAQIQASIRGKKDVATELSGYPETFVRSTGVGTLPDRYLGVWAGDLPTGRGYAAVWGGHYPSGATVLQGVATDQAGNGFSGWLTGCMPAGGLDDTVIAARLRTAQTDIPGSPLVIIAPATAVTAEVSFGSGAPITVPLTQGGGFLQHGGTAGQVRALDAAGHVVGTGVVDRGLGGLPLSPR